MDEAIKEWMAENAPHTGQRIGDREGHEVVSQLGFTPKMHRDTAEKAADLLGLELNDIRTMGGDELLGRLRMAMKEL